MQTRLVSPSPNEQNYHIFYQMLAGLTPEERSEWEGGREGGRERGREKREGGKTGTEGEGGKKREKGSMSNFREAGEGGGRKIASDG